MENERFLSNNHILTNRLQKAVDMLRLYNGTAPMHLWLKEQFKKNRNWGSRDRKFYKEACYSLLRSCPGIHPEKINAGILALALRAAGNEEIPEEFLIAHARNYSRGMSAADIIELLDWESSAKWNEVFEHLDTTIEKNNYQKWFEKPAPLWTITAIGKEKAYTDVLNKNNIAFEKNTRAVKIEAGKNLEEIVPRAYYRVMDISTQLSLQGLELPDNGRIWDCCSGSGGKSLLIRELATKAELYCSDIRETILENLKIRFEVAGLKPPQIAVFDSLSNKDLNFNKEAIPAEFFDLIIADLPCSGSGTWRRNPENLHFFKPAIIEKYAGIQRNISLQASRYLKSNGRLVYLTCSVFDAENRSNVDFLEQNGFKLLESGYTGGPEHDGDYIFRAILEKS